MFSGEKLIPRLNELNRRIDRAYRDAAKAVDFSCAGCDGEKCCTVDLNLHTSIEMYYLRRGFSTLDRSTQMEILDRCESVIEAKMADRFGERYRNSVCVLNKDGRCILYDYRPMICRLAGIPYYMVRPDKKVVRSGGCTRYQTEIEKFHPNLELDRTAFYREMALIEIEMIKQSGKRTVTRTISEVLGLKEIDIV